MNEEAINEIVKEYYGFTIDEIDENVGNLSLRVNQLQYNNKKFQQENQQLKDRIDKAIEYIEKDYKFANYDIPLLTKDEQLAGKLLKILKEN